MKQFSSSQVQEVFSSWRNTQPADAVIDKVQELQAVIVEDFIDYLFTYQFSKPITPNYEREKKAMNGDRVRGKIKWFNKAKGYGFILTDDGDVFIHCSSLPGYKEGMLDEGIEVEFDVYQSSKGPQARDVILV